MDAVPLAPLEAFGLQHTHVWVSLSGRLKRTIELCSSSKNPREQAAYREHFAGQLVEHAKQYSAGGAPSDVWKQTHELNSMALLAIANMFDRIVGDNNRWQPTAPQVRALLGGRLAAAKEEVALSSAFSLFMQQASSTIGGIGSGWAVTASSRSSAPPSPAPPRHHSESPEAASPDAPPRAYGKDAPLPRNGSEALFNFEE